MGIEEYLRKCSQQYIGCLFHHNLRFIPYMTGYHNIILSTFTELLVGCVLKPILDN